MAMLKRYIYYFLILVGILGIIDTISLFFYTNINTGTLLPAIIGIIFTAYSILKLWILKGNPVIKNSILRHLFVACIAAAVSIFIILDAMILINSASQQDIKTDYLLILGAGIRGSTVSWALQERLDKGIEYLNEHPQTKVIVSGGQGTGEDIPEAVAMEKYLVIKGIRPDRIIKETKATSTMENFKFTKELIPALEKNDNAEVMVITSDFHMLRAKMLARRAGLNPYGISSPTPLPVLLNNYLREPLALVKSYLFDK